MSTVGCWLMNDKREVRQSIDWQRNCMNLSMVKEKCMWVSIRIAHYYAVPVLALLVRSLIFQEVVKPECFHEAWTFEIVKVVSII